MRNDLQLLFLIGLTAVLLGACGEVSTSDPVATIRETVWVSRTDGSGVEVLFSRPDTDIKVPVLLYVAGSGCISSRWEKVRSNLELPNWLASRTARVIVEKPGVAPGAGWGTECSEAFLKYYSIDQRIIDHLTAIQYVRRYATWWNGKLYIYGYSDGAAIAASVAAFTPETRKAVFGGMGGGMTMAEAFEDYIACSNDRTDDRDACIAQLRELFDEMRRNPTSEKTWSGSDNSYKVWATRLDILEANLLRDLSIPFLVVHGADDRDGVPVESARRLVLVLEKVPGLQFEYWEIPEMSHAIGNLEPERGALIRGAIYGWLFDEPQPQGGPPDFGRQISGTNE